jgi:hypothetical protein
MMVILEADRQFTKTESPLWGLYSQRSRMKISLQWLTRTRLRTALAMWFFCTVFLVSVVLLLGTISGDAYDAAPSWGRFIARTCMAAAFGSVIGAIATVLSARGADRRTAKESVLEL